MGCFSSKTTVVDSQVYMLTLHNKQDSNKKEIIGIYNSLDDIIEAEKFYLNNVDYDTRISNVQLNYKYSIPDEIFTVQLHKSYN